MEGRFTVSKALTGKHRMADIQWLVLPPLAERTKMDRATETQRA